MKSRYTVLIIACAVLAATAAARDHDDGGLPGAFALMAGDARSLALGGAGVALERLPGLYYNPAALATVGGNELASTYRALSFDRRIIELGYGRPLIAGAGVGLSWTNASVSDLVGRNYAGNPTEKIDNSQNMFVFGFGRPVVLEWIQAGVGGRFYYTELGEGRASGYGLDAGVRVTPWEWVTAAAAIRDVATGIRWEKTETSPNEDLPMRVLLGFGVRPWQQLLLVFQGDTGRDECWRYHGGAEYWLDERVALRAGLDDGAPTLGAAVVLPRGGYTVGFDYAYAQEEFTAEAAHTMSLGLSF